MARNKNASYSTALSLILEPETSRFSFALSREAAKALLAWCSVDETRRALSSVLLEHDGARVVAVATDGHRLLKLDAPGHADAPTGSYIVPRAAIETAMRAAKKGEFVLVQPFCDHAKIGACPIPSATFPDFAPGALVRLCGETFPPYAQVIPAIRDDRDDMRPARVVGFNPRYLGDVALVADACGAMGGAFRLGGELDPARIDVTGPSGDAVGVVMPMRI